MKAKYSRKKYVWVAFDLENFREIGCAFTFFFGGNQNTPFTGEVKEKMDAIVEALKQEILEKVSIDQECANFSLCLRCGTEIDLRKLNFRTGEDGFHYHVNCPTLKPMNQRDFPKGKN